MPMVDLIGMTFTICLSNLESSIIENLSKLRIKKKKRWIRLHLNQKHQVELDGDKLINCLYLYINIIGNPCQRKY